MELDFSKINNIAVRGTESPVTGLLSDKGTPIQAGELKGHTEPLRSLQGHIKQTDRERLIEAAIQIIENDRINHEISEGCRLQILQDLERKENPYKLLLFAAEAIGRLSNCGDSYYLQVKNKLIEVYGHDVSED